MTIPDWIPLDAWEGYVTMRKKIKKPLTERAMGMAVRKLERMFFEGQDIRAVLEQSEFNCWQDLYPVKGAQRNVSAVMNNLNDRSWAH